MSQPARQSRRNSENAVEKTPRPIGVSSRLISAHKSGQVRILNGSEGSFDHHDCHAPPHARARLAGPRAKHNFGNICGPDITSRAAVINRAFNSGPAPPYAPQPRHTAR